MKKSIDSLMTKVVDLSRGNVEAEYQMIKTKAKQREQDWTINSWRDDIRRNKVHAISNNQHSWIGNTKILGKPEGEYSAIVGELC